MSTLWQESNFLVDLAGGAHPLQHHQSPQGAYHSRKTISEQHKNDRPKFLRHREERSRNATTFNPPQQNQESVQTKLMKFDSIPTFGLLFPFKPITQINPQTHFFFSFFSWYNKDETFDYREKRKMSLVSLKIKYVNNFKRGSKLKLKINKKTKVFNIHFDFKVYFKGFFYVNYCLNFYFFLIRQT